MLDIRLMSEKRIDQKNFGPKKIFAKRNIGQYIGRHTHSATPTGPHPHTSGFLKKLKQKYFVALWKPNFLDFHPR